MTVLIAGAGIGGLTLGLTLHGLGIPFRVFEAVHALRPLGVGINLQPHATRELMALGLSEGLEECGLRTAEVAYFSSQGLPIWSEPRGMDAGYRWPQYSVHRGKLQMMLYRALLDRAGPGIVQTSAALRDWRTAGGGVEATFIDRDTQVVTRKAHGSLLVAADGINSTARATLHPDEGPAVWRGTIMWRGVTRGPKFLTGRSMAMAGTKDCKFVCYPIADTPEGGSVINWIADLRMPADYHWAKQDWNRKGHLQDFMPQFADWHFDWLDIPRIIGSADEIWEYPMVDRNPLDLWTAGNMTLLGDAAHAMYPIGSNGASQAILDARVLGRALRDHGQTSAALQVYEDERRSKVNALVLANRGDGPDRILDIVAARAPQGYADIETVMPLHERIAFAQRYKLIAGMDREALNASPPIL